MESSTLALLERIGDELDGGRELQVFNGGLVLPSEPAVAFEPLGREKHYEQAERPRRPATESWPGTRRRARTAGRPPAPRPGPATGSWTAGDAAPVLGWGPAVDYREALSTVGEAYPGARMWEQGEGFWLWAESTLLPGLHRAAVFLVGVSIARRTVRSWAFWQMSMGASWIGPRHTNFPDGSICAYDARDLTWVFGQSLVNLLDIYSVWALRHLHLEVIGRWPGPQIATIPYEVVLEVGDTELCPCGTMRRYADCCKAAFSARNRIADAVDYCLTTAGGRRFPPAPVLGFVRGQGEAPSLRELI